MSELQQLERKLAILAACADIGVISETVYVDDAWWSDTHGEMTDGIRYLELIGKIERHPERPELVRVVEL